MYVEDNEYETDDDDNNYSEYNDEILIYEKRILIVNYYKNLLHKDPEFIGINNISSAEILKIIEQTNQPIKLSYKDYILNLDQIEIFIRMYNELEIILDIEIDIIDIYTSVTKIIFNKIYIH